MVVPRMWLFVIPAFEVAERVPFLTSGAINIGWAGFLFLPTVAAFRIALQHLLDLLVDVPGTSKIPYFISGHPRFKKFKNTTGCLVFQFCQRFTFRQVVRCVDVHIIPHEFQIGCATLMPGGDFEQGWAVHHPSLPKLHHISLPSAVDVC